MHGRGTGGGGIGPPVTPPIVKTLLIATAVVFLAQKVFEGQLVQVGPYPVPMLEAFLSVWPALVWQGGYVWQPFTYMWLHASFFHIAMNMFMLWMFGSQLAMVWGAKRFLRFYLICGVGAGLIIATVPYLLFGIGLPTPLLFPTLGASGAIYGVLLGYSLTWPERTIMLIFPPIAFRAIWLIPALFFMSILGGGSNVSHVGHLGGVVVGWLYLRRKGDAGKLFSLERLRYRWRRYRMRQRLRSIRYEDHTSERRDRDDQRLH